MNGSGKCVAHIRLASSLGRKHVIASIEVNIVHAAALLGARKDDVVPATEILYVVHEQLLAKGLSADLIKVLQELAAETRRLWSWS